MIKQIFSNLSHLNQILLYHDSDTIEAFPTLTLLVSILSNEKDCDVMFVEDHIFDCRVGPDFISDVGYPTTCFYCYSSYHHGK
jgi:hypothetical protein